MGLSKALLKWFKRKKPQIDIDKREFEWCIVGNIIKNYYWGENKEIKSGTKHFRPGAKVYCMPEFHGSAHERIRVLGKPKGQNRYINIVIQTSLIKNFRLQKVYHSKIQFTIGSHIYYWGNRRVKNEIENLNEMIVYLNTLSKEINI